MTIPIHLARALSELSSRNILTLRRVKLRFQIGGGTDDALGVENATWTLTLNGRAVGNGTTGADGEVSFLISPGETLVLNIFDTDYNIRLHAGLQPVTQRNGQQKRLDALGYMTGYLRTPIASDQPDDGTDGPRTRQSLLQFQTDETLRMDSVPGNRTRTALTNKLGS